MKVIYDHFRRPTGDTPQEVAPKLTQYYRKLQQVVNRALEEGQIKRYETADKTRSPDVPWAQGMTVCFIVDPAEGESPRKSKPLATGFSFCSKNDNFEKRKGRAIAFGRAVGQMKKSGVKVVPDEWLDMVKEQKVHV